MFTPKIRKNNYIVLFTPRIKKNNYIVLFTPKKGKIIICVINLLP